MRAALFDKTPGFFIVSCLESTMLRSGCRLILPHERKRLDSYHKLTTYFKSISTSSAISSMMNSAPLWVNSS